MIFSSVDYALWMLAGAFALVAVVALVLAVWIYVR